MGELPDLVFKYQSRRYVRRGNRLLVYEGDKLVSEFVLSSRGLKGSGEYPGYDDIFGGHLTSYLREHPTSTVLDVAGGVESQAVRDISEDFHEVGAVNLDIAVGQDPAFRGHPVIWGDMYQMPIRSNSIDAAICVYMVQAIPHQIDYIKIAKEVHRVLKPEGRFFVNGLFSVVMEDEKYNGFKSLGIPLGLRYEARILIKQ